MSNELHSVSKRLEAVKDDISAKARDRVVGQSADRCGQRPQARDHSRFCSMRGLEG